MGLPFYCFHDRDIAPEGKIRYATEIWNAMADGKKFSAGEKVMINGFWGMHVLVQEVPVEASLEKDGSGDGHATCSTC